ncbi:MAG: PilZ domain-containing protein [Sphingomicrobium sp.]
MDQSGTMQNRRSRRAPVLLAANIEVRGVPVSVKLRNLSVQGALIEGGRLPAEGSITHFARKDLRVRCEVKWVEGRFAGIRFNRELEREEVLRHIPPPRETFKPEFKRPGLACKPLTGAERKMIEAWICSVARDGVGE